MTDQHYTHMIVVADRSGSMSAAADDEHTLAEASTAGIRQLVKEQRAQPGKLTVSLVDFDTVCEVHEDFGDGSKSEQWTCIPRGGTALLDAAGTSIATAGERLAAMAEDKRPGTVIVIISTDGFENSSKEYTKAQVAQMIKTQTEDYGWKFTFIGANIDAFDERSAGGLGVNTASILNTSGTNAHVAYAAASAAVTRSRGPGGQSVISYTDDERTRSA